MNSLRLSSKILFVGGGFQVLHCLQLQVHANASCKSTENQPFQVLLETHTHTHTHRERERGWGRRDGEGHSPQRNDSHKGLGIMDDGLLDGASFVGLATG